MEKESKHMPGPYQYCGQKSERLPEGDIKTVFENGEPKIDHLCECGQIWSIPADCPIATVIIGEWGDEYPAIRIRQPGSIGALAEPYMEKIVYGSVDIEAAHATARLFAAAPDLLRQESDNLDAFLIIRGLAYDSEEAGVLPGKLHNIIEICKRQTICTQTAIAKTQGKQ